MGQDALDLAAVLVSTSLDRSLNSDSISQRERLKISQELGCRASWDRTLAGPESKSPSLQHAPIDNRVTVAREGISAVTPNWSSV